MSNYVKAILIWGLGGVEKVPDFSIGGGAEKTTYAISLDKCTAHTGGISLNL